MWGNHDKKKPNHIWVYKNICDRCGQFVCGDKAYFFLSVRNKATSNTSCRGQLNTQTGFNTCGECVSTHTLHVSLPLSQQGRCSVTTQPMT